MIDAKRLDAIQDAEDWDSMDGLGHDEFGILEYV